MATMKKTTKKTDAAPKKGKGTAASGALDSEGVKAEKARIAAEKAAEREAAKADKEAQKQREKEAKAKARERAKAEKEKEAAAEEKREADARRKAEKDLAPHAKEINVRLEKAEKLGKDADDHRVAAALRLEAARQVCETAGVNFKKWCAESVPNYAYETVRKLLTVGQSPNPTLAIADMRIRNAEANKRLRERKKTGVEGPRGGSADTPKGNQGPKVTSGQRADEALAALSDKGRLEVVRDTAGKMGHSLVPAAAAKVLHTPTVASLLDLFDKLSPADQVVFVEKAADRIGVSVVTPFDGDDAKASSDEEMDIPESLRRK